MIGLPFEFEMTARSWKSDSAISPVNSQAKELLSAQIVLKRFCGG